MSARVQFFHRQRVNEAELNLPFAQLEQADWNLASDVGIRGIISGAVPLPHQPVADLTIDLTAPGRAYDALGRRVFVAAGQRVDIAHDSDGVPTEVVTQGHERWVSVFLRFARLLSEPRTDGGGALVHWKQDEHFEVVIRQGASAPAGTATRPPLEPAALLVGDVRRTPGQTQILLWHIDTSRRQAFVLSPAETISVQGAGWSVIGPGPINVQAALDTTDVQLAAHFDGSAHRHGAAAVDLQPYQFVTGTNVQQGIKDVVDVLAATASGAPGASRVGADTANGTPFSLAAGTVDAQLSTLLGHLNQHTTQANAHTAGNVQATAHNYISSTTVQAQLQEIVGDLGTQAAGQSGGTRIGSEAIAGSPLTLATGTVRDQLAQMLLFQNGHLSASSAHPASVIPISDTLDRFAAQTVEGALGEILAAYEDDHFRENQANAGQHRAIHQPVFGSGRVLLWDAMGTGGQGARYRVYADDTSVWHVFGASWNGSAWVRDASGVAAAAWRFGRQQMQIFSDETSSSPFPAWEKVWTLPLLDGGNSSTLVLGGSGMRETGRVTLTALNTSGSARQITAVESVTFRHRFAQSPSSIELTAIASTNWVGTPAAIHINSDGFVASTTIPVSAGEQAIWHGRYVAIL